VGLVAGEELEGKASRPLPVERAVQRDLLVAGACERDGAVDVEVAGKARDLFQLFDEAREEVAREERHLVQRLGIGSPPGLRVHEARGSGAPGRPGRKDRDVLTSARELPGQSQGDEPGSQNHRVDARRKDHPRSPGPLESRSSVALPTAFTAR
jgi:hypothetical protein